MEQPLASGSGSLAPFSPALQTVGDSDAAGLKSTAGAGHAAEPSRDGSSLPPPPASLSFQDQQTLAQLRRGDWSALEPLVARYQDRLYVTILRMVGHPDDAADLVQETFVRAMQGLARFEGKSSLYTWLFRIAVNVAISHRRASRVRNAVSLDGDGVGEDDGVNRQAAGLHRQLAQATETDPSLTAEQRIDYETLLAALAKIDPELRAAIVLRDIEECDYEQIAAILDVPLGTVKSRLFRARAALRDAMRVSRPPKPGTR